MTRRSIPIVVGACVFAILAIANAYSYASESWKTRLYEASIGSVVSVLPQTGSAERNLQEPEGTGVVVGDGTSVLTADHVLGRANRVFIRHADGSVHEAKIGLRDGQTDLALLDIEPRLEPLSIDGALLPGSDACAIGNAFGLGLGITCGTVSAVERRGVGFNLVEDFIQLDAPINPGMSGAPLFDSDGRLAGLVTAIFTKGSDANIGVNFASSARLLNAYLEDAEDGRIDRPRSGLAMRPDLLPGETGSPAARIMQVATNSPEEQAGLMVGDRMVKAGQLAVTGQQDYLTALALAGKPAELTVTIDREGNLTNITIEFN